MRRTVFAALAAFLLSTPALADPSGAGVTPGNAGTQSYMSGCVYSSSPPTATNGQQMGVRCDANGNQIVTGSSTGGGPGATVVTTTTTAGTITLGGTAQNALAANASRKVWCIQNNSALTEPLFVRAAGTASATVGVQLSTGAQACNQPGTVDQGAISVVAATTGHTFVTVESQ
jgi:hypothetical protein